MEDFIGKYNGNQIDSRLDKVKDMVGATASGAGAAGLVPAPAAEKRTAFLRGDGTWQDIDVHEPGFLSDNFYDENDFRYILFNIAFSEVSTITQEQYDIIASKCEVDKSMQYLLLGLSTSYGVGDVIITKDSSENIQAVLRTGGKAEFGYMLSYNVIIDISKDLTFTSSISQYTVHMVDNQSKDIALTISDQNGDNRIINFSTAGAGTKALMDDGTYKEIGSSGVDISSYILEGIDFKKNTTKEGFDKIKSCVINKQHMYLYFYNAMDGNEVAFYADVIAGVLYGNLNLCVYDFGSSKIVNVDINLQDYSITVNTQ
nr:MAG TPA: hypothetical protein [Caudoviricetes sp.]